MPSSQPVLLIIDYNLSRIGEVSQMRDYARSRWGAQTWLIRSNPQPADLTISDAVFDVDPLSERFVEQALDALGQNRDRISAGLVFSDNAVASGAALLEVAPYLESGVLAEQLIPYRREFSYDGLASLSFVTEKVSAEGRYPVEIAQVLPARLTAVEHQTLLKTGAHINRLIGQQKRPFHNEIKLSDDGTRAAVVEPNRRPGGMKIWSLAQYVHGPNLFEYWIDSVFGTELPANLPAPSRSAATVMLGVHRDVDFAPRDLPNDAHPFSRALQATAAHFRLSSTELIAHEFAWLGLDTRPIRSTPRDNADFAAQVCIVLDNPRVDIRDVVKTLREQWLIALKDALEGQTQRRIAS